MIMSDNKKLYRSTNDKMIFGVCGGLGEYFNIDPVIMRIIFVILAVWGGSGVLIYIILAIVIPEKPDTSKRNTKNKSTEEVIEENVEKLAKDVESVAKKHSSSSEMLFGLILLLVGLMLMVNNFFPVFEFRKLWPLTLIVLAIFILARGSQGKK
jgi:phage shock protein C